jgi:uncharacterized protein YkwD
MKSLFTLILLQSSLLLFSQNSNKAVIAVSPLAPYSSEWNDVKYSKCNTAVNATYLSKSEKEVIYILNLIRSYPPLFAKTVLKKYPVLAGNDYLADDTYYFKSLVNMLLKQEPMQMLYPDNDCFVSAKSHAYQSGITGYVGHERKTRDAKLKKHYSGECCDYGHKDALDIVLSLLIDEGIPSLSHRNICLSNYSKLGVSIQPHNKYGTNTVLDFYY